MHKPVSPSQIILNGDSAGGGIVLALLQVIRDQGLPMPAGAIVVSPWGDLTHSFPSTLENNASVRT
jgi:acetyl esterase/lipase